MVFYREKGEKQWFFRGENAKSNGLLVGKLRKAMVF
jgi:hypothetical protein